MIELWKYIDGYEGKYAISTMGRVKSFLYPTRTGNKKRKVPLLMTTKKGRYLQIGLRKDGKKRFFLIHRLVGIAFIPNPKNKLEIDHIDGNKHNNCINNLRWATRQEQIRNSIPFSNTGIKGVHLTKKNGFQADINMNGKCMSKFYSINKYGAEEALKLAIKWREDKEKEIDPEFYGH